MNFLQIVQKTRVKCRMPGTGNVPAAVTGQNEEYSRLISFVQEAWLDIQGMNTDWNFLRASCSATTLEGTSSYTAAGHFGLTDFGHWALDYANGDTFRCYLTATGVSDEQRMGVLQYDEWRNEYLYGSSRTSYQRPSVVAAAPDRSLAVGPIPLAGYTIAGDYYKAPSELASGDSTPALPSHYHWAIVYRAMMAYGVSENAPEVFDEGQREFNKVIRRMVATELRQITMAPPLC